MQNNLSKNKRIFWLGMHKLLVTTELQRLRMLGYEVFNPPYLSSIIDQSAVRDWTVPPDSTLPKEAIAILAKTNFFYEPIPEEAAEILNHYFEAAIVTINPDWLKNFLCVYHGKVIYRVYGQPYSLSQYLNDACTLDLISERENFWFCPHHEKTLLTEDTWLSCLNIRIIPYCLSDDITSLQDQWTFQDTEAFNRLKQNMGLICPRIVDSPYYNHYYQLIKKHFLDEHFKIFGKQIISVADPQVLGTLKRKVFLEHFLKLKGFIYHYPEPAVCYLPPIEFMTLGGPVIFLKGCLLSRYFNNPSPGEARDMTALKMLANQLKKGNATLTKEIIENQKKVRTLYHPSYVWPIFDKTMTEILETRQSVPAFKILYNFKDKKNHAKIKAEKSILIPFHRLGSHIEKDEHLNYYSAEGIIRVTGLMVKTLTRHATVIITAYRNDFGKIHGFFTQYISDHSRLKIFLLGKKSSLFDEKKNKIRSLLSKLPLQAILTTLKIFIKKSKIQNRLIFLILRIRNRFSDITYVRTINQDKTISHIIIPHYFLFPETLTLKKPLLLYLPDYLPHFYNGSLEMGDYWLWRSIGRKLAKKAKLILTNSEFTRHYLPHSALKVKKEKIISFPLTYLNQTQKKDKHPLKEILSENLPELFIFYPTRNRTSKRLDDFSKIVMLVNTRLKAKGEIRRIYGVLTTRFTPRIANNHLINLSILSDPALMQIYQRASALVFTSENEGNFPTQINEALHLNTPVIATRIPQITNELGATSDSLQLIEIGNYEKFADAILYTLDNREKVLNTQEKARNYVMKNFSYEQFANNFLAVFYKNFMPLSKESTIDRL